MSSEPPVYTYLNSDAPREDAGQAEAKEKSQVEEITDKVLMVLTWVALAIVLAIWAVVGAIFWIPLLVRAMLKFSISLVEATFEGRKPTEAAKILRNAVSFYRRGFVVAVEVVTGEDISDDRRGPMEDNRLLFEIVWALVVWYFILLGLGWIQGSPLDLLDWFLSIPWTDHIRGLIDSLTGGRI